VRGVAEEIAKVTESAKSTRSAADDIRAVVDELQGLIARFRY
jgi:hypothetical protein